MPLSFLQRWPGYSEAKPRERQLALWEGNALVLPSSDVPCATWQDFKTLAFSYQPLPEVYVSDIINQPWWADCLADPDVRVMVPTSVLAHSWNMVQSVQVKKGRKRVWIISSRTWHQKTASPAFLAELDALFALCGVGVRPTPGSLGQAIMRKHWQREERRWVSRPTNPARIDLLAHSLGGRVDYFTVPSARFEKVYESDISGAYGSVCDRLPTGNECALHREPEMGECVTYFMECVVRIPEDSTVAYGIFGEKQDTGQNYYPIQPGEYRVWLWKEEVDLCRRNGWLVMPTAGWGWRNWNDGLANWAQAMYQLRLQAEASIGSSASQWMKLAMVAALGRFGMPLWSWKVVPGDSPELAVGDLEVMDKLEETGYFLHKMTEWASNHLSHWYSYILMRARLVLRSRMVWEHEQGNTILMSNYDAIYCLLPTDPIHLGKGLGQWKQTLLTKVRFPFPRGIVSREKTTLPGVKR